MTAAADGMRARKPVGHRWVCAAALVGAPIALAAPAHAATAPGVTVTPVATGLSSPRGVTVGPDGRVYVAEGGVADGGSGDPATDKSCATRSDGSVTCVGTTGAVARYNPENGKLVQVATGLPSFSGGGSPNDPAFEATGPNDVAFGPDGRTYVVVGYQGNPGDRSTLPRPKAARHLGYLYRTNAAGTLRPWVDVANIEATNPDGGRNSDGTPDINSNPYRVAVGPSYVGVLDAGGNDLIGVTGNGGVSVKAVFPADRTAPLPGPPPQPSIPYQSVPDGLALSPGGSWTAGELTGFPAPAGAARTYTVPQAGGTPAVALTGFTDIGGVAYGPDGSLYVTEIGGRQTVYTGMPPFVSRLTRIYPDGSRKVLVDGTDPAELQFATGVTVAGDGTVYVVDNSTSGTAGRLIKITQSNATPPTSLPEASAAVLLPVAGLLALAGGWAARRRRTPA